MHREDVIKCVNARLKKLGVPGHLSSVRKVPCFVQVNVLTGDTMRCLELRSGITPPELEHKLNMLEGQWRDVREAGGHQVTLQEAIDEQNRTR